MTNYWMSFPYIFTDIFSEYNDILDRWFYEKLEKESWDDPVTEFRSDLQKAGFKTGSHVNPGLTHIFSLAGHFGYKYQDYQTAIQFIKLGLEYYSDYPDIYAELIEFTRLMKDDNKAEEYLSIIRKKINDNDHLTAAEKQNYLDGFNE